MEKQVLDCIERNENNVVDILWDTYWPDAVEYIATRDISISDPVSIGEDIVHQFKGLGVDKILGLWKRCPNLMEDVNLDDKYLFFSEDNEEAFSFNEMTEEIFMEFLEANYRRDADFAYKKFGTDVKKVFVWYMVESGHIDEEEVLEIVDNVD